MLSDGAGGSSSTLSTVIVGTDCSTGGAGSNYHCNKEHQQILVIVFLKRMDEQLTN